MMNRKRDPLKNIAHLIYKFYIFKYKKYCFNRIYTFEFKLVRTTHKLVENLKN